MSEEFVISETRIRAFKSSYNPKISVNPVTGFTTVEFDFIGKPMKAEGTDEGHAIRNAIQSIRDFLFTK